jgi:hypothetical protein
MCAVVWDVRVGWLSPTKVCTSLAPYGFMILYMMDMSVYETQSHAFSGESAAVTLSSIDYTSTVIENQDRGSDKMTPRSYLEGMAQRLLTH